MHEIVTIKAQTIIYTNLFLKLHLADTLNTGNGIVSLNTSDILCCTKACQGI